MKDTFLDISSGISTDKRFRRPQESKGSVSGVWKKLNSPRRWNWTGNQYFIRSLFRWQMSESSFIINIFRSTRWHLKEASSFSPSSLSVLWHTDHLSDIATLAKIQQNTSRRKQKMRQRQKIQEREHIKKEYKNCFPFDALCAQILVIVFTLG